MRGPCVNEAGNGIIWHEGEHLDITNSYFFMNTAERSIVYTLIPGTVDIVNCYFGFNGAMFGIEVECPQSILTVNIDDITWDENSFSVGNTYIHCD
jgi:hypothetical protein